MLLPHLSVDQVAGKLLSHGLVSATRYLPVYYTSPCYSERVAVVNILQQSSYPKSVDKHSIVTNDFIVKIRETNGLAPRARERAWAGHYSSTCDADSARRVVFLGLKLSSTEPFPALTKHSITGAAYRLRRYWTKSLLAWAPSP